MSVAEARQAFAAALRSGLTGTPAWRRELESRGIERLITAVGADTEHPVANDIRARFLGVFVMPVGTGGLSQQRAARLLRWMETRDFAETMERWRSLASVSPEYARELLS